MSEMVPAVEIVGLKKSYLSGARFWSKRRQVEALGGIDLKIGVGEIFGLVGRNGYGKTTLIKCVAGMILPSVGQVRVFGHDTVEDGADVRKLIGWVGAEERSFYLRLTSRQNLMFFARLQGMTETHAKIEIERLAGVLQCEEYLDRRVHELSTGNRQRVSIIRGMLHGPRLLILDEPTRSLDPFAAVALRKTLVSWVGEAEGRSILITSHHLDEIQSVSHRIGIMGKATLGASGTIDELRRHLGGAQRVHVGLRRRALLAEFDELRTESRVSDLSTSEDGRELSFTRDPEDERLESVTSAILRLNLGLVDVRIRDIELQDLIDELEHVGS